VKIGLFIVVMSIAIPLSAQTLVPGVTSIWPQGGSIDGGTQVTIRGTNFQYGATVAVGAVPLEDVVVSPPSSITGMTAARATGVVNVRVTNPNGGSGKLFRGYTYHDGSCCSYPSFTTTALTGASNPLPASVVTGAFVGVFPDLVTIANGAYSLFSGNGTPGFLPVQTFPFSGNFSAAEVYDVDGDFLDDVAMAALGGNITTIVADLETPFPDTRTIVSTAFAFALDSADFNHDGVPDLVIPDHDTGYVRICMGNLGGGGCAASNTYLVGTAPAGVTTGDFNNDGDLDIAVSDEVSDSVTVLLGMGTGAFSVGTPFAAGSSSLPVMGLATGYLNGDILLDLVVSTGAVLLGDGDGTFTPAAPLPVSSGRHVVVNDFNRDGKIDVAIDAPQTAVHILLGDNTGNFVSGPTVNVAGGLYEAFATIDVDGNNVTDLVIGGSPVMALNTLQACPSITINQATIPQGLLGTQYGPISFTQTGGQGAITYTLSGALPGGLTFFGGTLSGTPTVTGTYPITVRAADANGCSGSASYNLVITGPCVAASLVATADTLGSVQLSWPPTSGATGYQVWRSSQGQAPTHIATVGTTTYTDAVSAGTTYVYTVRTVINGQVTCTSIPDIATPLAFSDPAPAPGGTVKAVHLTELRSAVNLVRAAAGLGPFSFTNPTVTAVRVKAVHITELRSALNAARATLGLPAIGYANTLTAGVSVIRAIDFDEIRDGVQ
jgi:hypothetical protein